MFPRTWYTTRITWYCLVQNYILNHRTRYVIAAVARNTRAHKTFLFSAHFLFVSSVSVQGASKRAFSTPKSCFFLFSFRLLFSSRLFLSPSTIVPLLNRPNADPWSPRRLFAPLPTAPHYGTRAFIFIVRRLHHHQPFLPSSSTRIELRLSINPPPKEPINSRKNLHGALFFFFLLLSFSFFLSSLQVNCVVCWLAYASFW